LTKNASSTTLICHFPDYAQGRTARMQSVTTAWDLIIKLLNTLGLGVLGTGIFVLFHSLQSRNKMLEENLKEIKTNYQEMLSGWKQQRDEINTRFEQENKFRALWKATLLDSEDHKEKIKAWRDEQVVILAKSCDDLKLRISTLEDALKQLRSENVSLKRNLKKLGDDYKDLETEFRESQSRNRSLSREIARFKGTGLQ
jgi:chromosome segregation ATPase